MSTDGEADDGGDTSRVLPSGPVVVTIAYWVPASSATTSGFARHEAAVEDELS